MQEFLFAIFQEYQDMTAPFCSSKDTSTKSFNFTHKKWCTLFSAELLRSLHAGINFPLCWRTNGTINIRKKWWWLPATCINFGIILVIMQFLKAFPNSKSGVSFVGFLLQTLLRSREKSLRLKSQFCRPSSIQLPMGCNQLLFDAQHTQLYVISIRIFPMFPTYIQTKSNLSSPRNFYLHYL